MTFLMILSVILLSKLMMLLSTVGDMLGTKLVGYLLKICGCVNNEGKTT